MIEKRWINCPSDFQHQNQDRSNDFLPHGIYLESYKGFAILRSEKLIMYVHMIEHKKQ